MTRKKKLQRKRKKILNTKPSNESKMNFQSHKSFKIGRTRDYGNYITTFLQILTVIIVILFLSEYYIIRSNFQQEISTHIHDEIDNHSLNHYWNNSKIISILKSLFVKEEHQEPKEETKGDKWIMVVILTLISSLAAGLGGVPFFFVEKLSPFYISLSNAIASGFLLIFILLLLLNYLSLIYSYN